MNEKKQIELVIPQEGSPGDIIEKMKHKLEPAPSWVSLFIEPPGDFVDPRHSLWAKVKRLLKVAGR